jgi:hypothetical protein
LRYGTIITRRVVMTGEGAKKVVVGATTGAKDVVGAAGA